MGGPAKQTGKKPAIGNTKTILVVYGGNQLACFVICCEDRVSDMPMRVLFYSGNYSPELTGVGRYCGELGAHLASRNALVRVVTTAPHYPGWKVHKPHPNFAYRSETIDGVRVTRCPMLMRARMRGIWRLLAPLSFALFSAPVFLWLALRWRPQVILVVEPTLFVSPVGLLAARLVAARTILHVQDLEVDAAFAVGHLSGSLARRVALFSERWLLAKFSHIVTISNQMARRLNQRGVPEPRLHVIRNWVDTRKIYPMSGANPFRQEFGIAPTQFVVLYAGNIGAKQALRQVLDAAEALQHLSNITFVIAGEGPEKPLLQSRYGTLTNVKFIPLQPEERLCDLLNLADVHVLPQQACAADLVLPSKIGGMLASGRPIVAAAAPGTELHDFLRDVAVLVPPGDSGAMREGITRLIECGAENIKDASAQLVLLDARTNLKKFEDIILRGRVYPDVDETEVPCLQKGA